MMPNFEKEPPKYETYKENKFRKTELNAKIFMREIMFSSLEMDDKMILIERVKKIVAEF